MKSGKTRLVGRPLLSRLRRRFAPLRGTQRRCAALFFAPPWRYAPCTVRPYPGENPECASGHMSGAVVDLVCSDQLS